MTEFLQTQIDSFIRSLEDLDNKIDKVLWVLGRRGRLATFEVSRALGYVDRQGAAPTLSLLWRDRHQIRPVSRKMNPASGRDNAVWEVCR